MLTSEENWWATDHPAGKRVGWMMPYEFVDTLVKMFGSVHEAHAPFIEFSAWVGVGKSTVYRWANGEDPIPKWVALLFAYEDCRKGGSFPPSVDAPWLPYSKGANGRQRPVTPPHGGVTTKYDGTTHADRIAAAKQKYITHR